MTDIIGKGLLRFFCSFCQHQRPRCPHQRHFNTQILLVLEDEVLEHGVVEGGELGQGLDELQAVLPLTVQDQLLREREDAKRFEENTHYFHT